MNITRLILALLISCTAACTLSQHDPTGLVPMRQAPQPGFTKLSEHFGVEVSGGTFTARTIRFFHLENRKRELIGADLFPIYASRQGAYAVSADGMTLLFMNDERASDLPIDTGLYEYTEQRGIRLVDSLARSGIYINDSLPEHAMVFRKLQSIMVRDTDGNERKWEPPGEKSQPTKAKSINPW